MYKDAQIAIADIIVCNGIVVRTVDGDEGVVHTVVSIVGGYCVATGHPEDDAETDMANTVACNDIIARTPEPEAVKAFVDAVVLYS